MKKLILLTGLLMAFNLHATVATKTVAEADATNTLASVVSEGCKITLLTVANAGTNNLTLSFFDAPSTNLTWTNAAWAYLSNYTGNVTSTVVTSFGTTNSYVYSNVLLSTSVTNAASTNSFVKLGTIVVPAGETMSVPFAAGLQVFRGLGVTNTSPGAGGSHIGTIVVTYGKQL